MKPRCFESAELNTLVDSMNLMDASDITRYLDDGDWPKPLEQFTL